jgi:hypothetical protein
VGVKFQVDFHSPFGRLADQRLVDVREHTSTSDRTLDEGIQLFIFIDSMLKMERSDTLHLQIHATIPR